MWISNKVILSRLFLLGCQDDIDNRWIFLIKHYRMKAAVLARSGYFQLFIPACHTCIFHVRNKAARYVSGVLGGNESLSLFVYCGSGRKD